MKLISFDGSFAWISIGPMAANGVIAVGGIVSGGVIAVGMNTAGVFSVGLNAVGLFGVAAVNSFGVFTRAWVNAFGVHSLGSINTVESSYIGFLLGAMALALAFKFLLDLNKGGPTFPLMVPLKRMLSENLPSAFVQAKLSITQGDKLLVEDGEIFVTLSAPPEVVEDARKLLQGKDRQEKVLLAIRASLEPDQKAEVGYREALPLVRVLRVLKVLRAPDVSDRAPTWIFGISFLLAGIVAVVVASL